MGVRSFLQRSKVELDGRLFRARYLLSTTKPDIVIEVHGIDRT